MPKEHPGLLIATKDEIDQAVLRALQYMGRMTARNLADDCGYTVDIGLNRIQKALTRLRKRGLVEPHYEGYGGGPPRWDATGKEEDCSPRDALDQTVSHIAQRVEATRGKDRRRPVKTARERQLEHERDKERGDADLP